MIDYAHITKVVSPLIAKLDHKNLNKVLPGDTTAENIAFWFYMGIRKKLPVSQVDVHETTGTCCSYRPEPE